jgi:protein-disulfide isomerase
MTTVKKLKKFQVDNDVLEAKYHKETAYPDASNVSSVFFGNINAPYQTTILINPQCSHCRDLFEKVEPLLRKKSKKIGVRFILLSFRPQNDYACKLFIAAKQQMSEEKALELYSLWFGDRSNQNETFAQSCGLELNHEKVVSEYELHKRWTKENNLHSTPFVLINNHTLPGMYEIEDIEKMDEI